MPMEGDVKAELVKPGQASSHRTKSEQKKPAANVRPGCSKTGLPNFWKLRNAMTQLSRQAVAVPWLNLDRRDNFRAHEVCHA